MSGVACASQWPAREEETTMVKRMLFGGLCVISAIAAVSATVFAASTLTERIEGGRMTVLKTDVPTGRFLCVEHHSWYPVLKSDLRGLQPGDIVRVEPQANGDTRLIRLRTAADELGSTER
jgi:hypothetical protein